MKGIFKLQVLVAIASLIFTFVYISPMKTSAQACTCWPPGSTSDQGCMAFGCPTGTRRVCNCNSGGSGGACTPVAGCGSTCGGTWSCYCNPDAACGGGGGGTSCTPNAERCNGCDRVRCLSDGSGEVVVGSGACCGGGGGGSCTPTIPNPPVLVSPANNSVVPSNNVTLNWADGGSWGVGCPANVNNYNLWLSQNCTGAYAYMGNFPGTTTSHTLNNLEWGGTYCWYVNKGNVSLASNSAVWRFTVNNNPIITSSSFGADTCGYSTTGRFDSISPNKVNPLTFNVAFSDPEADALSGIFIAFVPQSALNLNSVSYDQVYSAVTNNNTIATLLGYSTAGVLQSSWAWNMQSGGVNVPNTPGTASLLGAGTTSKANYISPGNWTSNISVRFENSYPSGLQNVYVMATVLNPDGTYSTPNQGSSSQLMMTKVGSWSFDMTNPTGSISVSNYTGSNFTAAWSGTDASGLKNAFSYIVASTTGSTLTDTTGGYAINPLGTTDLNYPSASNAGIGIANLPTTRTYAYTGTSDYTLKLALEDRGCNVYTATAGAVIPSPWLYSREGIISANGGVSNIKIPSTSPSMNIPNFLTPTAATSTGVNTFVSEAPLVLGTLSAISGTASLPNPVTTVSSRNMYTYNYNNQATAPDQRSNNSNWYSYIQDLITTNANAEVLNNNTSGTISQSTSASSIIDALKGSASDTSTTYVVRYNNGSPSFFGVGIASVFDCNRKVIFITPNSMTIAPNIRRTTGGCIFVSSGNMTISNNSPWRTTALNTTGGNSSYDILDGFFITDGTFTTTRSPATGAYATYQMDGLLVRGGVLATNLSLNTTLRDAANSDQPAEIYQYDPYYTINFKDVFSSRFYTIREYIP